MIITKEHAVGNVFDIYDVEVWEKDVYFYEKGGSFIFVKLDGTVNSDYKVYNSYKECIDYLNEMHHHFTIRDHRKSSNSKIPDGETVRWDL